MHVDASVNGISSGITNHGSAAVSPRTRSAPTPLFPVPANPLGPYEVASVERQNYFPPRWSRPMSRKGARRAIVSSLESLPSPLPPLCSSFHHARWKTRYPRGQRGRWPRIRIVPSFEHDGLKRGRRHRGLWRDTLPRRGGGGGLVSTAQVFAIWRISWELPIQWTRLTVTLANAELPLPPLCTTPIILPATSRTASTTREDSPIFAVFVLVFLFFFFRSSRCHCCFVCRLVSRAKFVKKFSVGRGAAILLIRGG